VNSYSRCRWEDNIKTDLQEVGWEGMDWIAVTQDWDMKLKLVNAIMNLWVPQSVGNFLTR
jgi:hypothetical protein